MPTAIAVTGPDLVLPSPDRHTPSAAVLQSAVQSPRTYSLDQALTEMHTLIEHHGYVIVLCPASAPPAVAQRLHAIRSVLESDRIAILRPDLPPLGLAVLALQLRQLSICDFSPGVLASAARLLSHYIYAGALLGSVAKLDRVPVTLQSHAKSWVPGAQFAVLATPRPELIKVTGDATLPGPGFGTKMLYATGQLGSAAWVTETLAPAWRAQGVSETRLPGESARWWATGKLVEFAAAIPDISVLYQLVASVRRDDCHWCGLELIGDRCGFCAAPLPPPPERSAPASASSAASLVRVLPRGAT
ncbi:hypothetical protein GCM10009837_27410 [Streptomyces durmitorensis]|uniref:Uncharacterized protein n=1 Tax=Streptomyces durmitorensis TaxID=319947 RepID=A0ABY4PRX3_9ACTN|nr:hypothetical protein [Streptomyces durmitorensis]UQT56610.1 hypothetical protein M4V62_16735 [Streptomyces durmitorensis]